MNRYEENLLELSQLYDKADKNILNKFVNDKINNNANKLYKILKPEYNDIVSSYIINKEKISLTNFLKFCMYYKLNAKEKLIQLTNVEDLTLEYSYKNKENLYDLYITKELNLEEIAEMYNKTYQNILYYMKKFGIESRPVGRKKEKYKINKNKCKNYLVNS